MLRFLAGITKLKDFSTPSSFAGLLDQPRKCGYTAIDYTIRPHVYTWVYEALRKEIIRIIFKGDITVELVCLEPVDFAPVAYIITHSHCKWILSLWDFNVEESERGIDALVDEIQASDSTGGKIVGLTGGIDKDCNTFNGLRISLRGLNRIFRGIPIQISELALDLPARCSEILWPDMSSLQLLELHTEFYIGENFNWELDYLLPQLSLSSLGLWFPSSSISLKDKEAVANYITKTSTLKELYILELCEELEIEEIFVALQGKGFCNQFTLHIMGPECDIIENSDAKILASYIRTNTLSRLVFEQSYFSAFGALQVARAIRDVPDLNADKLYFDVIKPSDVYHTIELTHYFDLVDKEQTLETLGDKESFFGFAFLLPDSTTVEWGFSVNDGVGIRHVAEAVCNNSRVRTLRLCNFYLSDVDAKALAEIFNCHIVLLEKLDLSHNRIGSVGMEALAQAVVPNTVLKKLVLSDNDVGDDGAKALAEVLNCKTILEELDLSDNGIGNVGVEALAQVIGSNTTLKELSLRGNDVGDVGAKALAEVLNCNNILEELDLSLNGIGEIGTEALAQAIGSNTALKKLVLSDNDVGHVGAKALAAVLNCNNILEKLDLSFNRIGCFGAQAFAQAIGPNTTLKKLVLSSNGTGDIGAIALAEALHSNSSLKVLKLFGNCIGDSGAKAFAEALHHNSTITHLDLSRNEDIGEEGVHHLTQALTVNDSISENGLTLDWKGSKALPFSYKNVENKIEWA